MDFDLKRTDDLLLNAYCVMKAFDNTITLSDCSQAVKEIYPSVFGKDSEYYKRRLVTLVDSYLRKDPSIPDWLKASKRNKLDKEMRLLISSIVDNSPQCKDNFGILLRRINYRSSQQITSFALKSWRDNGKLIFCGIHPKPAQ